MKGKVWVFENDVDTDQILPGYAMAYPRENLKEYALAGSKYPDFAKLVEKGDILVAGENFGCGSSREQAPVALKKAGVSLIIAKSFARIFRRNAINIGLPVLMADLLPHIEHGDMIEVNLTEAKIFVPRTNFTLNGEKLSQNVLETLEAGGLINKVRKQLAIGKEVE